MQDIATVFSKLAAPRGADSLDHCPDHDQAGCHEAQRRRQAALGGQRQIKARRGQRQQRDSADDAPQPAMHAGRAAQQPRRCQKQAARQGQRGGRDVRAQGKQPQILTRKGQLFDQEGRHLFHEVRHAGGRDGDRSRQQQSPGNPAKHRQQTRHAAYRRPMPGKVLAGAGGRSPVRSATQTPQQARIVYGFYDTGHLCGCLGIARSTLRVGQTCGRSATR